MMRVAERIRLLLSPRTRLFDQLAATAADAETLSANLSRHSERCDYPTLKAGLAELAAAQRAQSDVLRRLLLENSFWPKLPGAPVHEGSSNWQRLQHDLALQLRILRALQSQLPQWMHLEVQVAERLRKFVAEQDRLIGQLRDFTLRCDPQALD